jgi:serine/threonine protein kinase
MKPPQTPNTLRNVGRWTRGKLIGRGATGSVYLCHPTSNPNKPCAVKQLILTSDSASDIKNIQNEIEVLRGLRHPNVVRYLGSEHTPESLNIFLECGEGGGAGGRGEPSRCLRAHSQTH